MENVENDSALNHSTIGNQHSACEGKLNFDLVSNSRTYNFQAEDEQEYEEWISVLNNAMQEEFNKAMNGESSHTSQYDLSDSLNLSSHRGNSNNNNSITNGGSLATGIDLAYSTLTCQGNNPAINSKHVKSDSFGDSLPGSENDLLDSSGSQASRSRESHLDNVDAISTDAVHPIESKGRPSKGVIQSSLRFYASGNEVCADCSRPDPEWVSVNLGILICLECCGAHRELGVHYSRTQSLLMDELSTNQLLLPRFIGNQLFNSVFESSLPAEVKPNATDAVTDADGMTQRRAFIKSKYVDRRFITKTTSNLLLDNDIGSNNMKLDDMNTSSTASVVTTTRDPVSQRFLRRDLLRAVKTGDLPLLIQVYAERLDLMTPFQPEDDDSTPLLAGTTALHIAIETTNKFLRQKSDISFSCLSGETSWNDSDDIHEQQVKPPHCNLPLVEFIIQNALPGSLKRANELGDTALHHAARYGCVDALKLLVQAGGIPTPILQLTNKNGQTALDIVEVMLTTESNPSELVEAYKSCQQILKLADLIASSISSNTNRLMTDSICSLFPNTDGSSEKISMHRANLTELLDRLNSVNWCQPTNALSPSTTSYWAKSGKYRPANKRVPVSSSSTITTTPGVSTANTTTTTTASEAFSSKLGYFSLSPVIKTTNQSSISSPRDINSSKTTSSGKQITFEENRYATSKNVPTFNKPIRSFSHYSPSAHYGSVLATLPRKKGPAPRPPSIDSQANDSFDSGTSNKADFWSTFNRLDISRIPSSPSEADKQLPSDHIDIILDVLEERPTISTPCVITSSSPAGDFITNNTNTVFTSRTMKSIGTSSSTIPNDNGGDDNDGITTSPPIPPKPSYLSNTLYSTLPNRSLHVNRTSSVSVNSNLPTVLDSSSCLTSSTSTPATKTITTTTSSSSSSHCTDSLKYSLSQHINDRFGNISSAACIPASITASLASKSADSPSKLTSNGNNISVANCKVGDLLEALYDCEAENSDELTFSRGEIIQICDKPDDDWWEGVIHSDKNRRGMFPVTYVKPYHNSNDND
ncbi:unnamed protein product [Trichobilharzia szidati]|nr:unnamed protein product [Trichobilharzia szidati]